MPTWKIDDNGNFVKGDDGNPVVITDIGEERSVDYAAMIKSLADANSESAKRKEIIRKQEALAKAWEGIEDIPSFIAEARKNAEAVAAFDDKQRNAEDAVQARIKAVTSPLEKQVAELEADNSKLLELYHSSMIGAQFGTSKYVSEELVSSAMAQELFSRHFSIDENGNVVGRDTAGNVIYDENGVAGFDAALRKIVAASPYKAYVTKGSDANGSGAQSGGGSSQRFGGPRSLSECKTREEKLAYLRDERNLKK